MDFAVARLYQPAKRSGKVRRARVRKRVNARGTADKGSGALRVGLTVPLGASGEYKLANGAESREDKYKLLERAAAHSSGPICERYSSYI
jgi:hypothetical protein